MRWLVTGANGMLGKEAVLRLQEQGERVTAATRRQLDVLHEPAVCAAVAEHDVVLNCAAWTAVDEAEAAESSAFAVNAIGAAVLARAAGRHGARLVQLSTDYVFDGEAQTPYTCDALPHPRSAYGRTKAAGEWAVAAELPDTHLIVRTAWLYGAHGRCFPRTVAAIASEKRRVSVVEDQVGQPTWTRDVVDFVVALVTAQAPPGIYHATSSGQASWFEFARAVCEAAGLDQAVIEPTTSAALQRAAPRPAYSVLDHEAADRAGFKRIGDWRDRWREAAHSVLGPTP